MVDTENLGGGNFLTAKDRKVGDRVKVLVTGEGKIQPAEGEFKAALILDIKFEDKPMLMRLGVKNVKAVSDKYGKDTKNWVGKNLEFIVVMTNFQNKLGFQVTG